MDTTLPIKQVPTPSPSINEFLKKKTSTSPPTSKPTTKLLTSKSETSVNKVSSLRGREGNKPLPKSTLRSSQSSTPDVLVVVVAVELDPETTKIKTKTILNHLTVIQVSQVERIMQLLTANEFIVMYTFIIIYKYG